VRVKSVVTMTLVKMVCRLFLDPEALSVFGKGGHVAPVRVLCSVLNHVQAGSAEDVCVMMMMMCVWLRRCLTCMCMCS